MRADLRRLNPKFKFFLSDTDKGGLTLMTAKFSKNKIFKNKVFDVKRSYPISFVFNKSSDYNFKSIYNSLNLNLLRAKINQ
jgi:hypothetical protein